MSVPVESCPICSKSVISSKIDEHVNICLDGGDASGIGVVIVSPIAPHQRDNGSTDIDYADLEAIRRLQSQEDAVSENRRRDAEENERFVWNSYNLTDCRYLSCKFRQFACFRRSETFLRVLARLASAAHFPHFVVIFTS